jgi:hypothetical protein
MSGTVGTCTNFGGCSNADRKIPLEIPLGAEFRCPECGLSLSPVARAGMSRGSKTILAAAGVLLALSLVGFGVSRMLGREKPPKVAVAGPVKQPVQPQPPVSVNGDTAKTHIVLSGGPKDAVPPRPPDSARTKTTHRAAPETLPPTRGGARRPLSFTKAEDRIRSSRTRRSQSLNGP